MIKKYQINKKIKKENKKHIYDIDAGFENLVKKNIIIRFFQSITNPIINLYVSIIKYLNKKHKEKLTLMFIPHNEKKTRNFHISNLTLTVISSVFFIVVLASSVLIVNHNSTVQEVDKLKVSQKEAKIQFSKIRDEIKSITGAYEEIRQNIGALYSMSNSKKTDNEDNLWFAQGGVSVPIDAENNSSEKNDDMPIEVNILNRILQDMKISEKPLEEIEEFIGKREKIIKSTPTLWPVKGYIVNPYGFIRHSDKMNVFFNNGVDIASSPGAEVVSSAPGIVTSVKKEQDTYWSVTVRHNYGYETIYKGMERVIVSEDEKMNKGETIGFMGYPQNSIESILHYQIKVGVESQNPIPYLSFIKN
ncbi:MAG: M23 family metallopeptidase [Spirochaetia bacterium]|nr:M23 family metallopeptidase [Spirochaetia bacterium]